MQNWILNRMDSSSCAGHISEKYCELNFVVLAWYRSASVSIKILWTVSASECFCRQEQCRVIEVHVGEERPEQDSVKINMATSSESTYPLFRWVCWTVIASETEPWRPSLVQLVWSFTRTIVCNQTSQNFVGVLVATDFDDEEKGNEKWEMRRLPFIHELL